MKKPTESALVKACLEYLKLKGIFAWRQNTGGMYRQDKRGRTFRAPAGLVGVSDILAILPPNGRLLAVECKMPDGKLSPHQKAFLEGILAAGGLAIVARSVDDLWVLG